MVTDIFLYYDNSSVTAPFWTHTYLNILKNVFEAFQSIVPLDDLRVTQWKWMDVHLIS